MLDLNDIRLGMLRSGTLVSWKGELEVVSHNLLLYGPDTKDYDAIVTAEISGRRCTFALEYEQTAKSLARYLDIRKTIEADITVDMVLYLTPNQELQYLLTREFSGISKQLVFGVAGHFK